MAEITRKGDRIEIGSTVRIEAGPPLRRRKATADSLANSVTAAHYQIGRPDALGKLIEEGKMFSYLDHYGEKVYYVFQRRDIGTFEEPFTGKPDGSTPPLNEGSTNIRGYSYVFEDRGSFATEDEAIEFGQQLAGEE